MNRAIILSGGVGRRVGYEIPKQFIEVFGKTILQYVIEIYENHTLIDDITIVSNAGYIGKTEDIVRRYNYKKIHRIIAGGEDSILSAFNGITCLEGIAKPDDILIFHAAACPATDITIVSNAIEICLQKGNSMSSVPSYMLYGALSHSGDSVVEPIDREKMVELCSPQCLRYSLAYEVMRQTHKRGLLTDFGPKNLSILMLSLGIDIFLAKGSRSNIKITTRDDINLFESMILFKRANNE